MATFQECHFWGKIITTHDKLCYPNSTFLVGIDLVPIQPDFTMLGNQDLKQRIHWVHSNLYVSSRCFVYCLFDKYYSLEEFPFENEKFDYV